MNTMNAIVLKTNNSGTVVQIGEGAGKRPTAVAVLGDLIHLATVKNEHSLNFPLHESDFVCDQEIQSRYYIHIQTKDREGILAKLTKILAKYHISLAFLQQRESKEPIEIAMFTHLVSKDALELAMMEINKLEEMLIPVVTFPIITEENW